MNELVVYNDRLKKQSRYWFAILYTDNNDHMAAISLAKEMANSLIMKHDRSFNDDGTPKKEHYHVCFRWENGYYLSKLIKYLWLTADDSHLFLTLNEIRFKKFDDYIIYLTHKNTKDKEIYSEELFMGGLKNYAISICKNLSKSDYQLTSEIIAHIKHWKENDIYFNTYPLTKVYIELNKKFGYVVYKKWHTIKDFILDYKRHY